MVKRGPLNQEYLGCVSSLVIADKKLYSSSQDGTIKVWELNSSKYAETFAKLVRGGFASLISFENKLISSSLDGQIKIWERKTKVCTATIVEPTSPCIAMIGNKLFSSYLDVFSDRSNTITIRDFAANNTEIFEEIARLLESRDPKNTDQAIQRFSKMPKTAKNKIYLKLHQLIKPSMIDDYKDFAEHVFHGKYAQWIGAELKARAIRNYLQEQSS